MPTLDWIGKKAVLNHHNEVPFHLLKEEPGLSVCEASNNDSKEKRRLGELWALKSEGKCLFVMPKGKDWDAIRKTMKAKM